MNTPTVGFNLIIDSTNLNSFSSFNNASLIYLNCIAITDNTSISILLNSSKQDQAP